MSQHRFFATSPKGMEGLLEGEIRRLGGRTPRVTRAGVAFEGSLKVGYGVCLWSRIANRVLLPLAGFPAPTSDALYHGVRALRWEDHLSARSTLAVDCVTSRSAVTHSHYAALKTKDAIVDRFRDAQGVRPSVDTADPDLRINLHIRGDQATISLDLSGGSLHMRGYRQEGGQATLKENLAAAVLMRAGWPEIAQEGGELVDPMCGTGTLPIEAALMAGNVAPGLGRSRFGFERWRGHGAAAWKELLEEARELCVAGLANLPPISGFDSDARAVAAAHLHVERAGLHGRVHIERRELGDSRPRREGGRGLFAANPPYGHRIGAAPELTLLYSRLGKTAKAHFPGWTVAVLTASEERRTGLRPSATFTLYNGALKCRLSVSRIASRERAGERAADSEAIEANWSEGAEIFANRLRKKLRLLRKWARKNGVFAYRIYDADLPDYSFAIDLYHGSATWAHVQEYAPPASVDPAKAEARRRDAASVIPMVLEIPSGNLFFKMRRRQRGTAQYERTGTHGELHEVREGPCTFLVNFTDHIDSGLFLDHRPTRERIAELAGGKRFLNLFGYTGTATVRAAKAGANHSTTVDMSRAYITWTRRNFERNGIGGKRHELIQADCVQWLREERSTGKRRFDLIFLDPPTFSNSKRMRAPLEIARDHPELIRDAASLLADGGVLLFSTHARGFELDPEALEGFDARDITAKTIPHDFARTPKVHRVWEIRRR